MFFTHNVLLQPTSNYMHPLITAFFLSHKYNMFFTEEVDGLLLLLVLGLEAAAMADRHG